MPDTLPLRRPLRLAVDGRRPPQLDWHGLASDASGFGDEARGFLRVLAPRLAGLRLDDVATSTAAPDLEDHDVALFTGLAGRPDDGDRAPISVVHLPADSAFQRVQGASYHVARAMFEADGLPPAWVRAANKVDEIWVPSTFNERTFRASGVTTRIEVVPGGVDVERFAPGAEPMRLPAARRTVFLSIFDPRPRKGVDLLLRAWAAAFDPQDDVTLVLRASLGTEQLDGALKAFTGRTRDQLAPIILLGDRVADAAMPSLYAAADVVVLPTRGEGWSRTFVEAMACAKVVIAPRWSAYLDFMDDANSLLVDVDGLTPIVAPDLPCEGMRWAEPSFDSLVERLHTAAGDRTGRARIGAQARADMASWTWDRAAARVVERVEAIWTGLAARRPGPSRPGVRVDWHGDHFRHTSLAKVNRATSLGLIRRGTDVRVASSELPDFPVHSELRWRPLVEATTDRDDASSEVEVHFEWPPRFDRTGDHPLVVYQPWEFGPVPDEWVRQGAARVAEFWTPTTWGRDCFVMSGVPSDMVHVIPHGVDTDVYQPCGPRLPLRTTRTTKLLFVGGLVWRKGIDLLLDAYLRTFTADDDVCLVVKSTRFYDGAIPDQIRRVINLAADRGLAEIEHIDDDLDEPDMAALYRSCDALIHPYRGEGFALPVLEAMASGLPVAVTAYGACMDFCDSTTAALIPCSLKVLSAEMLAGIEMSHAPFCAEVDDAALCHLLRRMVDDPAANAVRAAAARLRVLEGWTVDHSVDRIAARLESVAAPRRRPVLSR